MRLMRVTAGSRTRLDRPGQVVVQAGQRGAVERAEAQHDALLVRLHAIDAAGQPQRHDGEPIRARPRPPVKPPRGPRAAQDGADERLQPGDQRVEVGQRAAARRGRPPNGPPGPPPQGPPPPGWPLAATAASTGAAARRPPRARATIVPRHAGVLLCGLGRDGALADRRAMRHIHATGGITAACLSTGGRRFASR